MYSINSISWKLLNFQNNSGKRWRATTLRVIHESTIMNHTFTGCVTINGTLCLILQKKHMHLKQISLLIAFAKCGYIKEQNSHLTGCNPSFCDLLRLLKTLDMLKLRFCVSARVELMAWVGSFTIFWDLLVRFLCSLSHQEQTSTTKYTWICI